MNERPSTVSTCNSAEQQMKPVRDETDQGADEITKSSLALLRQLEVSLLVSREALLAGDAVGLELATDEQRRLQRALAVLWHPPLNPLANLRTAAELRATQARVLHSGRILAGLLVRAERFRRALANMLLRPEPAYGPLRNSFAADTIPASGAAQEGESCRA